MRPAVTIFAERAVLLLAPSIGRDRREQVVAEAVAASRGSDVTFAAALKRRARRMRRCRRGFWTASTIPSRYLGSAEWIRTQLLGETDE